MSLLWQDCDAVLAEAIGHRQTIPFDDQFGDNGDDDVLTHGDFMSIKEAIAVAGRNLHTVIITAYEEGGGMETREAEPYSYRITGGSEKFFCYDISKGGIRNFHVSKIVSVSETENSFIPRWPVEV